ncbi:MAG TPA: septum site-determining protein MinC [Geminicoccaceae bacterium]|nr:septum site-determining protein MinC [Geminicoccaceae bacterium]
MAAANPPGEPRSLPFQVRGSLQTILSLRLTAPEDPSFFPLLLDKVAHAPDFFRQAPIVLDVAPIRDREPIDLAAFVEQLRQHRLAPVGLQNGSPAWNEAAGRAGLALFGAGGNGGRAAERGTQPAAPAPPRAPALVVSEPVRGGQQVQAPDGDLIVLGAVSHGAEIAAAGHVHVYGPLRGRAFAGIGGDERAMIFCDQLHAELLSIAGVYMVNEELDPQVLGRRARIACRGERLFVTPVP